MNLKFTKYFLVSAISAVIMFSNIGCAYRADLAQGNFVEQKDVDKLRIGMNREQVKFVLGTPMLTNKFHKDKWYFINSYREGWNEANQKTLIVIFDENFLVKDITGDFTKSKDFYTPL